MNLLDIILIILLIGSVVRGAHVGALRQFFLLLGLIAGLYASIWLVPYIAPYVASTTGKTLLGLVIFAILAVIFGGVFELIGMSRFEKHRQGSHLPAVNAALGAALGLILMLISIWLVAAAFAFGPSKWLSDELHHSLVVRTINRLAPAEPPQISRVQQFLSQVKLPQAFLGPEPNAAPLSNTTPANLTALVAQDGASVVKITGYGCGGILEGSGFVTTDHLVVTNAHVVAGVSRPTVHDQAGSHDANVIYFDPNLDIAILRVSGGLADQPLGLDSSILSRGAAGAVMGYPGGGNFSAVNAAVLSEVTAVGSNIYNAGTVRRGVYILAADVEPGNSGGPFVEANGQVGGVVFARSDDQADTGFALTAGQIKSVLNGVNPSGGVVGTGSCAAD